LLIPSLVVLFLLLLILSNVLLEGLVEFRNPAFDAAQVEWLAALFAIPQSRTLVDRVLANNAFLSALSKSLYEEDALLRKVLIVV
jgi:hypothetical protein